MTSLLSTLSPLLAPNDVLLTEADKDHARATLDAAVRQGTLHRPEATARHDLLDAARTRGDLRQVVDNTPPKGLAVALQVATAGWLVVCVVQFVIWLILAGFGHLDRPWWLWSDIGLGAIVAILWWTNESGYQHKSRLASVR